MRATAIKHATIFCVLSFLIGGIGTAAAQTMSYADAISQLAAACGAAAIAVAAAPVASILRRVESIIAVLPGP